MPVRVIFGLGTADRRLAGVLDDVGVRRFLVIVTELEEPVARRLVEPFAEHVAGVFTDVRSHVPTTGTAKAVALTTGLPIVAVPTTYAGSEVTPVWGLTEGARKTTGRDGRVLPRVVVYDPGLTATLPPALSAVSGLNSVEAFWAPRANPVTSLMAEEGLRVLAEGLAGVVRDPGDLDARSGVLYGAWLSGTVFAAAGSGVRHELCHVLGGAYDLPHAETHAVVLSHVSALVASSLPDVDTRVSAALGAPAGTPAADALAALARGVGAPTALREIGLPEDELPAATRLVVEQAPDQSPADIEALLSAAWRGEIPVSAARG
jgi:alcohol dehydrogenase class IV